MIKLFYATLTFSLRPVVEWRRLSRLPAKMTLVHALALLSVEFSFSPYNLKVFIFSNVQCTVICFRVIGSGIIWMDNVNCFGYETSLTQCRQVGWGLGNCDPYHREDAGVVCDNATVEEVSNNYCRHLNQGSCSDLKVIKLTDTVL